MNTAHRFILGLGCVALFAMALFPPWRYVLDYEKEHMERDAGYHFVFDDNLPTDITAINAVFGIKATPDYGIPLRLFSVRIDSARLMTQVLAVFVLTALLCLIFVRQKSLTQ
jgi:hypothetical protein